jgi:putative two-component system response regulator
MPPPAIATPRYQDAVRHTPSSTRAVEITRRRILVVDDEHAIRTAIAVFLRSRGHEVAAEESGGAALARLAVESFDLMICDVRMPAPSGLDVLAEALQIDPELGVLMLSAVDDAHTAMSALTLGAIDYLVKPIGLDKIDEAIQRAALRRQLEIDRRNVERLIREEVVARTQELEREKRALHELTLGVADALINAMEAKDVYLLGHAARVAALAASVAEAMGLEADIVENVRLAGRLHDIGKIGVRESVLNKPGPLTAEEFAHVRQHVEVGMQILAPLKHLPLVLQYVRDHHEHFDGSGYPRGIRGPEISIGGRILAACDAFDALTSRRAFREALEPRETIALLDEYVGRLLDPDVFMALRKVVLRRKTLTFIDDLFA